ncbi:MAG TPA: hypothetical protein VEF53_08680, partial [Patescibacteria group bacterium]|nr:hypothetical protein [Patescibacteria group bacterium]
KILAISVIFSLFQNYSFLKRKIKYVKYKEKQGLSVLPPEHPLLQARKKNDKQHYLKVSVTMVFKD